MVSFSRCDALTAARTLKAVRCCAGGESRAGLSMTARAGDIILKIINEAIEDRVFPTALVKITSR